MVGNRMQFINGCWNAREVTVNKFVFCLRDLKRSRVLLLAAVQLNGTFEKATVRLTMIGKNHTFVIQYFELFDCGDYMAATYFPA